MCDLPQPPRDKAKAKSNFSHSALIKKSREQTVQPPFQNLVLYSHGRQHRVSQFSYMYIHTSASSKALRHFSVASLTSIGHLFKVCTILYHVFIPFTVCVKQRFLWFIPQNKSLILLYWSLQIAMHNKPYFSFILKFCFLGKEVWNTWWVITSKKKKTLAFTLKFKISNVLKLTISFFVY